MDPSQSTLEIRLLGSVSLDLEAQPVTGLPSRAAEALLIYLSYQDRPVPRETLAELLWADRTPKQALTNLRTVLTGLRRELGEFLIISRKEVGFNHNAAVTIDARRFEERLQELSTTLQSPTPLTETASRDLQASLDLYQGDFLEGFYLRDGRGFEEWAALQRERLRRLAHIGFRRQVTYYLHQGDFSAGIQLAERLLALDPLDENSHRLMMQLLLRDGQRNAAIKQFHHCKRLLDDELHVAPSPATTRLFERLRSTSFPPPHQIPPTPSPFIGRATELNTGARRIIDRNSRLLSILGPGGIGKTRLAVELARRVYQTHPGLFLDGVFFISLVNVDAPGYLTSTIAEVLDISFEGETPSQDQFLRALANLEVLFVLDNFEQLLTGAGIAWISAILAQAPGINLVLTSRERLRLPEEEVLDLGGLSFPPPGTDLQAAASYSAMALFLQNARRVRPLFEPDEMDVEAMIRICRLVDGMPLGIELAASGVRYFSPKEIQEQLEEKLDLDFGPPDHRPTRHQSLEAVFDHSWSLLSEEERRIARRFAVFSGPFDTAAAEAVTGATRGQTALLFDKSLIRRHEVTGQFDLHPLMRQFLMAKLTLDPEETRLVHRRHAEYFDMLLQPDYPDQNMESQYFILKEAIEENLDNTIAAAIWLAKEHDFSDSRLVRLLERIFFYFGRSFRLERWKIVMHELKKALLLKADGCYEERWLTNVLDARIAFADIRLNAKHRAQERLEKILPEVEALGNAPLISVCHNLLAICAHHNGEFKTAFEHGQVSLEVVAELPEQFIWPVLRVLGDAAFDAGQLAYSQALHTQAYDLAVNRDSFEEAASLFFLSEGRILHRQGNFQAAGDRLTKALEHSRPKQELEELIQCLARKAHFFIDQGHYQEAARLLDEGAAAAAEVKDSRLLATIAQTRGWLAWCQADLPNAREYFQRSLDLLTAIDDHAVRPLAQAYLALVLAASGAREAEPLLVEAEEAFQRWGHKGGIALTYLARGQFHTETGDPRAALKALLRGFQVAVEADEIYYAVQILVALGLIWADLNEAALAVPALGYTQVQNAATSRDKQRISARLDSLGETTGSDEFQELQTQWQGETIAAVLDKINAREEDSP